MGNICCADKKGNDSRGYIPNVKTGEVPEQKDNSRHRQTKVSSFDHYKNLKTITDINEHYTATKILGKGSFGEVKRATKIATKSEHALKIIKKSSIESNPTLLKLMFSEL